MALSSLSGRIAAAGAATRDAMAEMLGVTALGDPYRVEAVAWMDHALEVSVGVGSAAPAVLRIEGRTSESKGLIVTEHLNIYFRGQSVPEKLILNVENHGRRRFAEWSLERFMQLLEADPELHKPGLPTPPSVDDGERPASLLDTWGAKDSYADFFAGGELARGQLDSIDPSRLFRFVQHCDNECLQVNPHAVIPTVSLVNYPWDPRVLRDVEERVAPRRRETIRDSGEDSGKDSGADEMVTTDLTEDDIILGYTKKLQEVLDYALAQPNPENKAIFFSNTCVPAVIGEDVESVVKQAAAKSGRQIFYLTVKARSMTTVFEGLLVERRLAAERNAGPPDPAALNLIGFPNTRAVRETEELLRAAGVRVNMRFLPELSPESIDQLPFAVLNVVYPNRTWQHFYDQLTFESRTPSITPAAPYGFDGTRAWLTSIHDTLGLAIDPSAVFERSAEPYRERWQSLRRRAREHRLGFVIRDVETYFLTTPGTTWGVPLLSLLEEMGFGLDILVHVSDPNVARENARTVKQGFREPDRHSIRAFDSFAFLRQRLRDSPADAFLSYHFFDWRLTEAGKAAFSIHHFEMGIPGAIRTLERLLRVCGTPFYRRYGRYLARTAEGLRATPTSEGGDR